MEIDGERRYRRGQAYQRTDRQADAPARTATASCLRLRPRTKERRGRTRQKEARHLSLFQALSSIAAQNTEARQWQHSTGEREREIEREGARAPTFFSGRLSSEHCFCWLNRGRESSKKGCAPAAGGGPGTSREPLPFTFRIERQTEREGERERESVLCHMPGRRRE